MNTAMFDNPITQDNLEKCRRFGMKVVLPAEGMLACGDVGRGKMPECEFLFAQIEHEIGYEKDFAGKRILVTAGPTREKLDPVRFISNRSTGKMGYAVAKAAADRGAEVTLVSGPVALEPPPFVKTIHVESAAQMFEAVRTEFSGADIVIKAAAVADYRPADVYEQKMKKTDGNLSIQLERTDDILSYLGANK